MHNLFLIMFATNTIYIDEVHMTLTKLRVKSKHLPFEVFYAKVKIVKKCINYA